jgi:2-polyprenyl-6-methoxyphenol hydroxylase-like FAD-dependent oxidoreductase
MRHVDIAIVGGGLAGSTAAAMLGRAGFRAILVDPHPIYPPDFRCEKLDGPQVRLLEKTGLADAVLAATTHDRDVWVARFGRLLERRPSDQYGILYDRLVNTVRAEIPSSVERIHAKTTAIATSSDLQRLTLSNGEQISPRLAVLASGLNVGLRHTLGITREILAPSHSVTIGFDINPVGRPSFDFRALTYYAERVSDRMAYLTLFPIGSSMRANLFVYRDLHDAWMRALRGAPRDTLLALMPGLKKLTGEFEVPGFVKIRPADLYVTRGHRQPGIVLVGDAFATSCPAAGTGLRKVFTDVERLCNVHVPRWLASEGMGVDKIAAFYDDPVKRACDAHSAAKAASMRSLSTDPGLSWQAQRWSRFVARLGVGTLRAARERFSAGSGRPQPPTAEPSIGLRTQA